MWTTTVDTNHTRIKLYRGDQELVCEEYNLHFHLTDENTGGGGVSMGIYVKNDQLLCEMCPSVFISSDLRSRDRYLINIH